MNSSRAALCIGAALMVAVSGIGAAKQATRKPAKPVSQIVGSKVCLGCHIKFAKKWSSLPHTKSLLALGNKQGCESCHGPGKQHISSNRRAITRFEDLAPSKTNDICLKCHSPKVTAKTWKQTAHAKMQMACTQCHAMHNPASPAKMLRAGFDRGCMCHEGTIREKADKGEHHKLPEGLACTQCHNPHGSGQPNGLLKPKDVLCATCHKPGGGPVPASHKTADWKKVHGAAEDKASCGICHGKENTCTSCHGGIVMPHPSDWMMTHKSKGASFDDKASCFKCHSKKEFCGRCHADKV